MGDAPALRVSSKQSGKQQLLSHRHAHCKSSARLDVIMPCSRIPSLATFLHLPRLAGIAGTTAGYNKAFHSQHICR